MPALTEASRGAAAGVRKAPRARNRGKWGTTNSCGYWPRLRTGVFCAGGILLIGTSSPSPAGAPNLPRRRLPDINQRSRIVWSGTEPSSEALDCRLTGSSPFNPTQYVISIRCASRRAGNSNAHQSIHPMGSATTSLYRLSLPASARHACPATLPRTAPYARRSRHDRFAAHHDDIAGLEPCSAAEPSGSTAVTTTPLPRNQPPHSQAPAQPDMRRTLSAVFPGFRHWLVSGLGSSPA